MRKRRLALCGPELDSVAGYRQTRTDIPGVRTSDVGYHQSGLFFDQFKPVSIRVLDEGYLMRATLQFEGFHCYRNPLCS